MIAAVDRDQDFEGSAGADSGGGSRGDLSEEGVGEDDADRTDDEIGVGGVDDQRVVSGGAVVCACLEHGGSGGAVGADGVKFQMFVFSLKLFDDGAADAAALSVYDGDLHAYPPVLAGRVDSPKTKTSKVWVLRGSRLCKRGILPELL